jgi:peptide chain release factor
MIRLLVTSGRGPVECRIAVAHILRAMDVEALSAAIDLDIAIAGTNNRPSSAIVAVNGDQADVFCRRWRGSILWTCQSPVRPNHRRKNWFAGVLDLPARTQHPAELALSDLRFEAFRAGGPGGQHQNKTESAVRVTHIPSGLAVVARDGRSQHRNKAHAIERLGILMATQRDLERSDDKAAIQATHDQLERGQPVRRFAGVKFMPVD